APLKRMSKRAQNDQSKAATHDGSRLGNLPYPKATLPSRLAMLWKANPQNDQPYNPPSNTTQAAGQTCRRSHSPSGRTGLMTRASQLGNGGTVHSASPVMGVGAVMPAAD